MRYLTRYLAVSSHFIMDLRMRIDLIDGFVPTPDEVVPKNQWHPRPLTHSIPMDTFMNAKRAN
jgi:hypothetical protein